MNLYRFLKAAFSTTFVIQVVCFFTMLIYFIFFVIMTAFHLVENLQLEILFILIALGVSCLVSLAAIGFFMRVRDRFLGYLGSEEEFPSGTITEKIVLVIWVAAILFFGAAVYYGLYLIYALFIVNPFSPNFGVFMYFIFVGLIIICLILQIFLVITAKYTRHIVKQVLKEE